MPGQDNPNGWTTVSLRPETRDRLRAVKVGGESYDDLLGKAAEILENERHTSDTHRKA